MISDVELLRRCGRDPDAVSVLYDRHARSLVTWLVGVCGDRELALDLVQETFARVLERGRRLAPPAAGTVSAMPLLRVIALNLLRDAMRQRRTDAAARSRLGIRLERQESPFDAVLDRLDADHAHRALADALAQLPDAQRRAVLRRVVGEHDYAAIGAESDVAATTVRARVSRGLRALHALVPGGES